MRFAFVLGVHAVLLFFLSQLDPELRRRAEPVLVSIITPADPVAESAPAPATAPTKGVERADAPRPRRTPWTQPATETPFSAIAVEAPPVQSSPVPTGSAPARDAEVPVASPSVAVRPTPAPVVPPRFDAAYLNNPRPEYPRVSKRMGERGTVMLRVYVSAAGKPERVEIRTSSGSPRLDEAARQAVEQWKFVPARQGDDAVAAWLIVPITFVLEG